MCITGTLGLCIRFICLCPPSLYDYYERKAHFLRSDGEYSKFVTPDAFEILAETIKKATSQVPYSDEQFANAVLTLVRQIPYMKSTMKYPIEALVENSGDCDVLSVLAASIMKAGGLDVVLLHYKNLNPSHMNVGVYLPYKPVYSSWWLAPTGFEYDNKTYWIAESTSGGNWKVGDKPGLLENAKALIIPLGAAEGTSPAQVSTSLDTELTSSSISAAFSVDTSIFEGEERSLAITGKISPERVGRNITMYVGREGLAFETFRTATNERGEYSFKWNFTQAGKYTITASLSGTADFAGSDSENYTVFAGVYELILDEHYVEGGIDAFIPRTNQAPPGGRSSQNTKYVLKNNVSGTGLLLSGEFMIMSENANGVSTIEYRIPEIQRTIYYPGSRQMMTVLVAEEQVVSIPLENSQLGFILRQDGEGDYSASISVLGDQQIAQISRTQQESNAVYINASDVAPRNKWYRIEATISENKTNAKLYEMNNTLLDNITAPEPLNTGEMGILMSYPSNSILAFKNLKVSTLDEAAAPLPSEDEITKKDEFEWGASYIAGTALLLIGSVALAYTSRRKRNHTAQKTVRNDDRFQVS